jgi:hypothetical protein
MQTDKYDRPKRQFYHHVLYLQVWKTFIPAKITVGFYSEGLLYYLYRSCCYLQHDRHKVDLKGHMDAGGEGRMSYTMVCISSDETQKVIINNM